MSSEVDSNQSPVRAAATEHYRKFIDLKSKLHALHTPKATPADIDWEWDATYTTPTPEHKKLVKDFFNQNQPAKTKVVKEDDFFA
ncbi:MAG TPA: hypothetical protein VFU89_00170 [Rhabdochlamydiaceae bacterium]|nr:hypothetical protein [Rhabdochlamydiaceae bacterium]